MGTLARWLGLSLACLLQRQQCPALLPVSLSHLVVGGEGVLLFVGGVVGVARVAW